MVYVFILYMVSEPFSYQNTSVASPIATNPSSSGGENLFADYFFIAASAFTIQHVNIHTHVSIQPSLSGLPSSMSLSASSGSSIMSMAPLMPNTMSNDCKSTNTSLQPTLVRL
jgi:hypothetical protein